MRKFFRSFLTSRQSPPQLSEDMPPLAPDCPLYVVGDIHGRIDLVEPLLAKIDADMDTLENAGAQLVFVGDYVDRGDASADVLARLRELNLATPNTVTCLMGNHERMMLDFIDDPAGRGVRWLNNGGLQTLASYHISGISAKAPVEELTEVSDALAAALPDGLEEWLRTLPLWIQSGNVLCVHAAMNPQRTPEEQDNRALLWGHQDFMRLPREDKLWVVHGHTIVKEPKIKGGRIAVDTGAWHSNKLTAAVIMEDECRFL